MTKRIICVFIPMWLLGPVLIRSVFIALGWVVVPIAALFRAYRSEVGYNGDGSPKVIYRFTWGFMKPWDNWDDGIANDTYVHFKSMFMKIVYWSCARNPANGLRTIPLISVKLDPEKIRFIGSFGAWGLIDEATVRKYDTKIPQWFLAWQGPYSNLYVQWEMLGKLWRFWIGWKIQPKDIYGGDYPDDYPNGKFGYRSKGSGPVIQLKRVRG